MQYNPLQLLGSVLGSDVAREIKKLSARTVATVTTPGKHADGGGLYLVVSATGAKRWAFIYRSRAPGQSGPGRLREMGLGSALVVSLARAREKATVAREQLSEGLDPLAAREAERAIPTFGEMADELVTSLKTQWRNEKHRAQWAMTLKHYAAPIRNIPVNEVDTASILKVLTPIWTEKPETASRLRGRIERVLSAAKARGFRSGENPATWRGHLDHLLPKRQKLSRGHHKAMPFSQVPEFVEQLRRSEGSSALALEFLILTAARSGEVLGARWDEVDLNARVWTVPSRRMKAGREHRVPLTDAAVHVLEKARELGGAIYIFPGAKGGTLSVTALEMRLRRMKRDDVTAHGFRSSFRDWAGEATNFAREVAESALAHTVGDAVERAYRRGDALEKRRKLMDTWSSYCAKPAIENVHKLTLRS